MTSPRHSPARGCGCGQRPTPARAPPGRCNAAVDKWITSPGGIAPRREVGAALTRQRACAAVASTLRAVPSHRAAPREPPPSPSRQIRTSVRCILRWTAHRRALSTGPSRPRRLHGLVDKSCHKSSRRHHKTHQIQVFFSLFLGGRRRCGQLFEAYAALWPSGGVSPRPTAHEADAALRGQGIASGLARAACGRVYSCGAARRLVGTSSPVGRLAVSFQGRAPPPSMRSFVRCDSVAVDNNVLRLPTPERNTRASASHLCTERLNRAAQDQALDLSTSRTTVDISLVPLSGTPLVDKSPSRRKGTSAIPQFSRR